MTIRGHSPRNIIDVIELQLMEQFPGKVTDYERYVQKPHVTTIDAMHAMIMDCIEEDATGIESTHYPQGMVYQDGLSLIMMTVTFPNRNFNKPCVHLVADDSTNSLLAMSKVAGIVSSYLPGAVPMPHIVSSQELMHAS